MKVTCDCGNSGKYKINRTFKDTNGNDEIITWNEGEFAGFNTSIASEHHGIVLISCNKEIQLF